MTCSRQAFLDQQEIPALLPHHVPPVDVLPLASGRRFIVVPPSVLENLTHAAKGAEIGRFAELCAPVVEHGTEARTSGRHASRDQ